MKGLGANYRHIKDQAQARRTSEENELHCNSIKGVDERLEHLQAQENEEMRHQHFL